MSGEHQGDMTSTSLPAGGEPDALHLHQFTHAWPTDSSGVERPERRCECGYTEKWVDHDDGHAGGFPHFCDGDGSWGWKTLEKTKKLRDGQIVTHEQGELF